MKQIIIGIVPRTMFVNGTYKIQLNYNYLEPFIERGVSTIILPLKDANIMQIVNMCDGFLIPGGGDIDPIYYNEENLGDSKEIDAAIDTLDAKVIKHAVNFKKPILGICRGCQALAAFLGGSLYQDIKNANLVHEEYENTHLVDNLFPNEFSKLFKEKFVINSFHHQVVKDLPKDFVTLFKHNDLIEGIMHKDLPILGIQWHPERLSTVETKIIFDYFIEKVKEYKNSK